MTLIQAQEAYINTVETANGRWAHRKDGGHSGRTRRGAARKLRATLAGLGFTPSQIDQAVTDANDMVKLNALAE